MPTLSEYVLDLLATEELNEWDELTVTALATGADARRTLTIAELIDTDTDADTTSYGGWYAFLPTTAEQQRVRTASNFVPSTGVLLTNGQYDVAVPSGSTVWLIRRLGVTKQKGRAGLRDAVNAALKDLADRHEITLTSAIFSATTNSYDVSAYGWLTQDRILELRRSIASNSDPWLIPGTPKLRRYGESMRLVPQIKATTNDTFTLVVARPSYTYIKTRRTARATATATAGAITSITVNDGGAGYLSVPSVTITGAGTGATATATLSGDGVLSIAVNAGGSGYVTATTTVTISAPLGAWADSTVGLLNLDDVAVPSLDDVTAIALYHAYLGIATGPSEDSAYWRMLADRQAVDAETFKWKAMPKRERNDDLLEDDLGGVIDEGSYSWP